MPRQRAKRSSAKSTASAAPGLRVTTLEIGGERLAVISYRTSAHAVATGLSAAEQMVLEQVLAGASNAAIARTRGTSVRTIANQIASIFRKLGVGSRRELFALTAKLPPGTS